MELNAAQDAIIEEFSAFDRWMDKYEYLIDLGRGLPIIDPRYKNDAHLIRGCQSRVWLNAELCDGTLRFTADSDAVITKGMIALLIRVLAGRRPEEVANAELYFLDAIGLREHLSLTRSNGLVSMVNTLKAMGRDLGKGH